MTLFTPRALKGIAATFTAALMLASCSTGSSDSTTAPETSNANGSEERIVTMGLGDVDTVLALGEQPVGYATWQQEGSGDPSGLGPWAKDKLTVDPNPIRDTTTEFSTDTAERVASLNPTKIIAVNSGLEADKKALLEQIAPTTFHSDAYEDWQVPWDEQIKEISKALNKEAEGEKLIAASEQAFQDFREAHPELQGKTAVIGMPYDGKFGVYTSGACRGAFTEKLGFKIPEKFNGDGSSFFLDWLKNDENLMDLDVNKRGGVYWLDTDTANAMSMPNPLTIPYAIEQIKKSL